MKIIAWNCNMAFRKKITAIQRLKPDILVISECEHPDKLLFSNSSFKPTQILWFGVNQHKGLAIIALNNYKLELLDIYNPAFRMVIPIRVTGNGVLFNLFAIWANNPDDPEGQYVEQVWKAINYYDDHFMHHSTILAGDFNSNTIWDRKLGIGNHSTVVKRLEEKFIYSAYHKHYKQEQGKEKHPTFYLYKHKDKPYHIDYCFVSDDLLQKLHSVEIGKHNFWMQYSDHVPVIVSFDAADLNLAPQRSERTSE
ncbi:endonuclease/exonuclease/phosphatase family protein [soil metagenome]